MEESLRRVIEQDINNLEIICIDDGLTYNLLEILKDLDMLIFNGFLVAEKVQQENQFHYVIMVWKIL